MLPQPGGVGHFKVAESRKAFLQELVGQEASLRLAVHCFRDFHIDEPSFGCCLQAIGILELFWDECEGHFHIFLVVERGLYIKY